MIIPQQLLTTIPDSRVTVADEVRTSVATIAVPLSPEKNESKDLTQDGQLLMSWKPLQDTPQLEKTEIEGISQQSQLLYHLTEEVQLLMG